MLSIHRMKEGLLGSECIVENLKLFQEDIFLKVTNFKSYSVGLRGDQLSQKCSTVGLY